MIKNKNKLRLPLHHIHRIHPTTRVNVFKEITAKYQSYFDIKCIYAFLNTDPKFMIDYCLIFKGKNDDQSHDIILFDIIPINGDRCTPEYPIYKKAGKEKNFFQYGIEEMPLMTTHMFYGFLEFNGYSRDKNSDKFWKKPELAKKVTKELFDWSLPYNRKKPELDLD